MTVQLARLALTSAAVFALVLSTASPSSAGPTGSPTGTPTGSPTISPTGTPTGTPTGSPTGTPTGSPTGTPTGTPTGSPTISPTGTPTGTPTGSPTGTPTGTPTGSPTGTPTGSPTISPTATPTATPTGTVTGSPTATPTGTPTGSPTATPTGTPTPSPTPTATPRPDLSGQYAFLDRAGPTVDDDNQSFLNIDTGSFRFCFAGLVTELDPGPLPQPEVVFEYRSLGDIRKATQRTVRGEFISVDLTLRILENGVTQFEETITSFCSLKASLLKAGEKARARLKCNVGEHLSAFEVLNQPGNEDFFDNVEGAYPRKGGPRHAKIDTRKGKIRIRHNGEPDVNGVVDLDCDLPNGD